MRCVQRHPALLTASCSAVSPQTAGTARTGVCCHSRCCCCCCCCRVWHTAGWLGALCVAALLSVGVPLLPCPSSASRRVLCVHLARGACQRLGCAAHLGSATAAAAAEASA